MVAMMKRCGVALPLSYFTALDIVNAQGESTDELTGFVAHVE